MITLEIVIAIMRIVAQTATVKNFVVTICLTGGSISKVIKSRNYNVYDMTQNERLQLLLNADITLNIHVSLRFVWFSVLVQCVRVLFKLQQQ